MHIVVEVVGGVVLDDVGIFRRRERLVIRLYMSKSQDIDESNKFNSGFKEALGLIPKLESAGYKVETINTDELSDEELIRIYKEVIIEISKKRQYGINSAFGSRSNPGYKFIGRTVPAVFLINEKTNEFTDVYPRQEFGRRAKTIKYCFEDLLKDKVLAV